MTIQIDLERIRRFWQGEGRCLASIYPIRYDYRKVINLENKK